MKRIVPFLPFIALAALWIGVLGYNHWRVEVFREGYERGMRHAVAYHNCFSLEPKDQIPPKPWRDEAWRFVNDGTHDCGFVVTADNYAIGNKP